MGEFKCVYVTFWLCNDIYWMIIGWLRNDIYYGWNVPGLAISAFFLCYGIVKSWDKTEAEGVFGGKLFLAGAFTDRTQRWNWSVDMILIGFGLWTAQSIYMIKEHQVGTLRNAIVCIVIFILMYASSGNVKRAVIEAIIVNRSRRKSIGIQP